MAKVRLNPIMEQIRGQIGDLVFKRYEDEVIISRKADREGLVPSEAQTTLRARFLQAVQYGKSVMADPAMKSLYKAGAKARKVPLFSLAVADFMHAPTVGEVNLSNYAGSVGDKITFRAQDDFGVASVHVSIDKTDGTVIESGNALETSPDSGLWSYTATKTIPSGTHVRITATALDRPGGLGSSMAEMDF